MQKLKPIILTLVAVAANAFAQTEFIESEPLPRPAESWQGPLFEEVGAQETGIDFTFHWDPPEHYKWHFDNAIGGGVAIGDYDADGLPDVFLTRAFGGGRLYRNLGNFGFRDVTASARLVDDGTWGTGASFVDLDNDGDLDLFVCSFDAPNRFYLNQGDGTFTERAKESGLDFKGASVMMAFADHDRDGDLDAYLLTNRYIPPTSEILSTRLVQEDGRSVVPGEFSELVGLIEKPDGSQKAIKIGQKDHFYRNNGDGTFTDTIDAAGISGTDMGLGVVWLDYDHDGWPDLYVSNDFYGADKLYHNNGNGTFTDVIAEAVGHTPWFSMGVDSADINNDGLLDLMASDMAATTHYKAKVNMGEMDEQSWFLTAAEPRQYMRNAVFLNSGTSRFMEVARLTGLANTDWTWSVKFADFDNDGWTDVFISNGMTRNWFDSDMRARLHALGGLATEEGGRLYLQAPPLRESNLAYRNEGGLRFRETGSGWGLDHFGVSFGAATGDLDGDGDLDLVVNNFEEPVSIYRNRSDTGNVLKLRLVGTRSNRFGIGARVRLETADAVQVRYLTLARGFASSDEPVIHFGLGRHAVSEKLTVEWPGGAIQTFLRLPANRIYTVKEPPNEFDGVRRESTSQTLFAALVLPTDVAHVEDAYDDFADQPLLPNRMSRLGPGLALGDIDGDGITDAYLGGAKGQAGRIVSLAGGGAPRAAGPVGAFETDGSSEDLGALLFDADSDGDNDLLVNSGGPARYAFDALLGDRLYLNDGQGSFTPAAPGMLPKNRDSSGAIAAADFDRDGDLDVVIGGRYKPREYPATPTSRLLINDGGRFTDMTEQLAPGLNETGMVTAALWSDVNNDGWIDLLLTHEWGPVKVFFNHRGKLSESTDRAGTADLLGWWNAITGRDIDNDGDIDYAVTNAGLNTKYHASPGRPALLYFDDFGLGGRMRIVEAEYEGDTLFPVRGRSCSTTAMPHLGMQFETFHKFASATLQDIYTPRRLENAVRLEVNTLESGMLLNDGTGRFRFVAFPRIAQAAPGFGVALTEVDGDGYADLFFVQNSFSPQPETGNLDGGLSLLLLGTKSGVFTPVWPDRSGLVVHGDAKALSTVDLNGDNWVDFAITQNDGPLIVFKNRGSRTNQPFTVRLYGKPGNLAAAGSRVTVILDDDSRQTAEVYAGNGYLSQSTNTLFFGLGKNGSAVQVMVRWPDGSDSVHMAAPGATRAEIRWP